MGTVEAKSSLWQFDIGGTQMTPNTSLEERLAAIEAAIADL
ncbi:hypothetical protein [Scytonema sp. NUACC26]